MKRYNKYLTKNAFNTVIKLEDAKANKDAASNLKPTLFYGEAQSFLCVFKDRD